ncbi:MULTISPECIES: YceH family protein [Marinomonas]|uniref:YceH family protein n=1 Tax=Marinomonas arctica TaxID=383750 RepID=A0A7H1J3I6_9GAMM|nr:MULTISPECIES: YceH family protein [Marinomonas]MCS7486025.1 hypothetical protein [Marinomonas sp. BSi20414]QNT05052.1 YceH family protein [Marinomonas arctica]GGN16503.1 UPF0502 protein [Marinomonas arctica]
MSYHEVNFIEMRVIGCLLEKEITTPDQYPLSLNALVNACNQKSNREPVTQLSESVVQDAVNALVDRGLVTEITGSHSRVSKYQHRFCNTEFSDLQLSSAETAIICLLFLRGAQTPGELRSRSGRLHSFQSLDEVASALQSLQTKTGGPYVCQLPREPGKREQRYQECFCSESERPQANVSVSNEEYTQQLKERVLELEAQVEKLNERIQELENASGL